MLNRNINEILLINFIFLLLSLYSIILSFYLIRKFENKRYTKLYKCQPKITDYSNIYQKLKLYFRNLILVIIFNSLGLYYFRNLFIYIRLSFDIMFNLTHSFNTLSISNDA